MQTQKLIMEAFNLPTNAMPWQPFCGIAYHISQELAAIYPQKVLLEGNDSTFNLEKSSEANLCQIQLIPQFATRFSQIPIAVKIPTI